MDIMFHVSTLIQPLTKKSKAELLLIKKKHIGNDKVVVVWTENTKQPFQPEFMKTRVTQVFIVLQPIPHPYDKKRLFVRLNIITKKGIESPPPLVPETQIFEMNDLFKDLLLTKSITIFLKLF